MLFSLYKDTNPIFQQLALLSSKLSFTRILCKKYAEITGIAKVQVLNIYKSLLRESQKLTNYNFRAYALRRVRDAFKENKALTGLKQIKKEFAFAQENLSIVRRQAAIGDMYKTEKLVIENMR